MSHIPVMLSEVLEILQPAAGEIYVDGTFGAGGYTKAILEAAACTVVAIDRDPAAEKFAGKLRAEYKKRFVFLRGRFGEIKSLLEQAGIEQVDGFVLDLGVSSMQIDQAGRGFSFRESGTLDMRMDTAQPRTAADIVNTADEKTLADIIYQYGEERHARRIARKIIAFRKDKDFETTDELAGLVRAAVPRSKDGIDPATRTFQALRIAVNDELGELERALGAAAGILKPGGRLVVVTFHSLEDRMVKHYLRDHSGLRARGSRHVPALPEQEAPRFEVITKKPLRPGAQEIQENPRARSARLRAALRKEAA